MQIWKYPIPITDEFSIELPKNSKVLSVQTQKGNPCIWIKASSVEKTEKRNFVLVGTGHNFNAEGLIHVGTFQMFEGALVWHLFERI